MTAPMPLSAPRTLRIAVGFAFASMVAAFGQSLMLLLVRSLFEENRGDAAWQSEGEDFSAIVIVAMVGSTLLAILLALSAVLTTVLSSQAGRIMLFVTAGLAIAWNLGCSCIFSIAWATGLDSDRNAGAEYYQSWQFTMAVLLGFAAGVAAVITVIVLAQRSVSQYYRALRSPY